MKNLKAYQQGIIKINQPANTLKILRIPQVLSKISKYQVSRTSRNLSKSVRYKFLKKRNTPLK